MYKPTTQTPLSLLCGLAGLSLAEAAVVLGVPEDTVRSWSSGRRRHPPGVLDDLRRYVAALDDGADKDVAKAVRAGRRAMDLHVPRDDFDAGLLGWRTVAEWRAYAGRVVARSTLPVTCSPVIIERA